VPEVKKIYSFTEKEMRDITTDKNGIEDYRNWLQFIEDICNKKGLDPETALNLIHTAVWDALSGKESSCDEFPKPIPIQIKKLENRRNYNGEETIYYR
jgi:hypothetical protein